MGSGPEASGDAVEESDEQLLMDTGPGSVSGGILVDLKAGGASVIPDWPQAVLASNDRSDPEVREKGRRFTAWQWPEHRWNGLVLLFLSSILAHPPFPPFPTVPHAFPITTRHWSGSASPHPNPVLHRQSRITIRFPSDKLTTGSQRQRDWVLNLQAAACLFD